MRDKLTKPDKILMAAYRLLNKKKVFSAEDLTVKSFELFPADFALHGYPNIPNSNQIYTAVMGSEAALIKKGFIKKVGPKQYKISDAGTSYVETSLIDADKIQKDKVKKNTNREDLTKMRSFFENKITREILSNKDIENYDFDDACSVWRISSTVTYPVLVEKFAQLDTWFNDLNKLFKKTGNKIIQIDNNIHLSKNNLDCLVQYNNQFKKKFISEIEYIKEKRAKPGRVK